MVFLNLNPSKISLYWNERNKLNLVNLLLLIDYYNKKLLDSIGSKTKLDTLKCI